jgi:hypothetical protein
MDRSADYVACSSSGINRIASEHQLLLRCEYCPACGSTRSDSIAAPAPVFARYKTTRKEKSLATLSGIGLSAARTRDLSKEQMSNAPAAQYG